MSASSTPANPREAARKRTVFLVQFAVLLALEAIVCFVPILGSIPFTPVVVATLSHIPVILTAVLLGPAAGAGMGFFFGLFSFLVHSFQLPGVVSFIFTPLMPVPGSDAGNPLSLLVCFVPRILIGVTAGYLYKLLEKTPKPLSMSAAAIVGSLTNTLFVTLGVYLFFLKDVAAVFPVLNDAKGFIAFLVAFVGVNGLMEVAVAVVLTAPVCVEVNRASPGGRS